MSGDTAGSPNKKSKKSKPEQNTSDAQTLVEQNMPVEGGKLSFSPTILKANNSEFWDNRYWVICKG